MHRFRVALLGLATCALAAQSPVSQPNLPSSINEDVLRVEQLGLHPWQDGLRGFGERYRADFTSGGMRFLPTLLRAERGQHLQLTPRSVMRGDVNVCAVRTVEPVQRGLAAHYEHAAGVRERYELNKGHVALSWVFDRQPLGDGDLVVRYAVDTSLPSPVAVEAGGLQFVRDDVGGVRIGGVTGVDADGAQVSGELRFVDGELELRLPHAFVETAAYPLVLDPLLGTEVQWTEPLQCSVQDAAYDVAGSRFLVVYLCQVGFASNEIRGCYVNANGSLSSTPFTLSQPGSSHARVANLRANSRFCVTWVRNLGSQLGNAVEMKLFLSNNLGNTPTFTIAQSTTGSLASPDVGCETNAPQNSGRGFVIVYDDVAAGEIRARKAFLTGAAQVALPPPTTVLSDTQTQFGFFYSEPCLSKAAANPNDLMLLCRSVAATFNIEGLSARLLNTDTLTTVTAASWNEFSADIGHFDVDGYDGSWVASWATSSNTMPQERVQLRNLRFANGLLTQGQQITRNATGTPWEVRIGFTPGRTWLGYRDQQAGPDGHLRAIDSGTCTDCSDTFDFVMDTGLTVATTTSGGRSSSELAVVAWARSPDLLVQRLRNYGPNGVAANAGGGCGSGGTNTVSHVPGIGSGGLVCRVSGLPPTALLTVFNLAPPQVPLACGPCQWTPFASTLQPPITSSTVEVEFPIPCLASLIGTQLETQWTTIDLTQTECPLLPGFVLSNRLLLTIGN